MENSMNEMYIQCVGMKRATTVIGYPFGELEYVYYRMG
jgi:hypothetical protein